MLGKLEIYSTVDCSRTMFLDMITQNVFCFDLNCEIDQKCSFTYEVELQSPPKSFERPFA